jgi:hypothetical protein
MKICYLNSKGGHGQIVILLIAILKSVFFFKPLELFFEEKLKFQKKISY